MILALPGPTTTRRHIALFVWASFLNLPYRWGGDDPLEGVDCSGLVNEGLKAAGLIPREADFTAHQLLYSVFAGQHHLEDVQLQSGCLLFWGTQEKIRHVEIVWTRTDGEVFTIGASGGGSRTIDRAEAVKSNAYVKIRRATPNWIAAVDPFDSR